MRTCEVISIGSSLRDIIFYAQEGVITQKQVWELEYGGKVMSDDVSIEHGGGASNTAVHFARLGVRAGIMSVVGNDEYGASIMAHLKKEGVDTRYMQKSDQHTGFSFILVHQRTGEHIAFIHYGAVQELKLPKTFSTLHTDWYYISSLNVPSWKSILTAVMNTEARIAWNPGSSQLRASAATLRPLLRRTEVLLLNEEEAQRLARNFSFEASSVRVRIKHLRALGPRIVVITRGRLGSIAYDGNAVYTAPRITQKPKDTTGAGDSYGSAFISGLIRYRGDIDRSMKLAAYCAEANVQVVGAQSGLLSWKQLPPYLRKI